MRRFVWAAAVAMILAAAAWADPAADFQRANGLYDRQDYAGAITAYEAVLDQRVESAGLYYNLGNAYFKSGDVGRAVLNYLRAKRLNPADEDIRHNLEFARQFSRVKLEGVQLNPISSFFEDLVAPYRLNTLAWTSWALFVLLCAALALRFGVGFRGGWVRAGIITSLALVLVAAGLTTFKYRTEFLTRRVVLIAEECPVQNGPTPSSGVEFQGAPGLVAEILAENDGYVNVLFENKRRGWIRRDLVAEV